MCRGSAGCAGGGSEHLSSRGSEFIETISVQSSMGARKIGRSLATISIKLAIYG